MPRPNKDEAKDAFLARYMGDAEARKSFTDEKQRYAVAISLWEHRNTLAEAANNLGYNSEKNGAEMFGGRHLQAGLVGYPEMKHPVTGKQGIDLLVEKDVIDAMRPSMRGVPVVNWAHDMSGGAEQWISQGKAVGVMAASRWDGGDAWEHCDMLLWDREAKANARNGFRLSNAWKEDEVDWTPGVHNGKNYDGRLKAAHYTHMAIVTNPRYEGSYIYANTLGGIMKLFGFGKTEGVELGKDTVLEIDGKPRRLEECLNALAAADAAKATVTAPKGSELKDEDTIEVDGKKRTVLEMKNALVAADKAIAAKPAPAAEPAKKVEHTAEEFANAVDARVKECLDKAVGEGFFNGIAKLAQARPAGDQDQKPAGRKSEKDRIAEGKSRFGTKKTVVAA